MKTLIMLALLTSTSLFAKESSSLLKQQWGELEDLKVQLKSLKRHNKHDRIGIHISVGSSAAGMLSGLTNLFKSEKRLTSRLSTVLVFGEAMNSSSDNYLTFDYHQLGKLEAELIKIQHSIFTELPREAKYENTVKWRPTYKNFLRGCKENNSSFKNDLYIKVYTDSIQESIGVILLNPDLISRTIGTKGVSSSLDHLLIDDAFINAMNDCQSEKKHHAFVRNMLVVDSIGKLVGISAGVAIYKGSGMLFQGISKSISAGIAGISWMNPMLLKRIKFAALTLGAVGYVKWANGLYANQSEIEKRAKMADPKVAQEVSRIKTELAEQAQNEINDIDEMLADNGLDQDKVKELDDLKSQWLLRVTDLE